MSEGLRRFDSPVARWPGYIMTASYMTFPELVAWAKWTAIPSDPGIIVLERFAESLPAALTLVKEFHLDGLPEKVTSENFPASPPLLNWLIDCVLTLYRETSGEPPEAPNSPGES